MLQNPLARNSYDGFIYEINVSLMPECINLKKQNGKIKFMTLDKKNIGKNKFIRKFFGSKLKYIEIKYMKLY